MAKVRKASPIPPRAEALGFHAPVIEVIQRIQLGLDGYAKSGKTHFTCEMSQHLDKQTALINVNKGLMGVIDKFDASKIMVVDIDYPDNDQGEALRQMKKFQEVWDWCMGDDVPTVVDKFTEVWGLAQMAAFGTKQPIPLAYRPLNDGMKFMLDKMAGSKAHVVLIHDLTEEYDGEVKTGQFVRQGFKYTQHKVEINAQLQLKPKAKLPTLTVVNNRWDMDLNGKELTGKDASFMGLGQLLFGPNWDPNHI